MELASAESALSTTIWLSNDRRKTRTNFVFTLIGIFFNIKNAYNLYT